MTKNIKLGVTGMHCASCAKIIERELNKETSVKSISINPLTEQADLEIDNTNFKPADINKRLKKIGYGLIWPADFLNNKSDANNELDSLKNRKLTELKEQKKKLQVALPIMAVILIIMFWSLAANYWPLRPKELVPENILMPLVFIIATGIIFWLGLDFLKAAGRFFKTGKANMDTLIGLGAGTAYFYSTLIYLFPPVRSALGLKEMYFFDVTIVVITLVCLGKYLENKAKLRTNDAIEKLVGLQTKTALVEKNGQEIEIPLAELMVGDIVIVKPGMKIPADGLVISGESAVDEALITGESLPIDKKSGDLVIGTTINKQGVLKIKINKIGADTVLAAIIRAIAAAADTKAPIQKIADTVAGVFVPIVLALAALTLAAWLIIAPRFMPWSEAVSLGITCFVSILAIACPCALGLATPTGIMVGLGLASKNGLLIKNAASLEKFGRTKIMVLDKTGTITYGEPIVSDIIELGTSRQEIITIAAALENNSEHPLAQAVVKLAKQENIALEKVTEFLAIPGQGVQGLKNGKKYRLGNYKMMIGLDIPETEKIMILEKQGKTIMLLAEEEKIIGGLALSDEIKSGAANAISILNKMGVKTIMLSGDHQAAADYIARLAGVTEVIAEVSPLDKADKIREIKSRDSASIVSMVGDGVNDAVALTAADIGVAMATGSDVAIESADIIVLHGDLSKIIKALKISRLTIKKIRQNLFWAFFYNIIAIPAAAGVFYPAYGLLLSPMIAAGAMSFSSLSVLLNTLLMRRAKI